MVWLISLHQERGLFMDGNLRIVHGLDIKVDSVCTGLGRLWRDADDYGYLVVFSRIDINLLLAGYLHAFQPGHRQLETALLLGGIHDLQVVDVLDPTIIRFAGQYRTVTYDIDLERNAGGDRPGRGDDDADQNHAVQNDAWPHQVTDHLLRREVLFQRIFGGVTDQAAWLAHLVHDRIANIDTGATTDTLVLLSFANVDTGRADHDTQPAVHAITQLGRRFRVHSLLAGTPRLTALRIIGDDQRIRIEHHPLETGIRTHVLADLLAQETGLHVAETAIKQRPEQFPARQIERYRSQQFMHRREVGDERKAGPD